MRMQSRSFWMLCGLMLASVGLAGEPLDKEYNLFYYSGWARTVYTNGYWGYKRHDYVGRFMPVRMNVPARELATNGVAFVWPANTNAPSGKIVVATVGIVAYPSDVDTNTLVWCQDTTGHKPPANGGCGRTYYMYVQVPQRANGTDWVIGAATGTLHAVEGNCAAGKVNGGCRLICGNTTVEAGCVKVRIPLGAAADKFDPHSGGSLALDADRLIAGLDNRSALVYKQPFGTNAVPVMTTNQLARIEVNNGYVTAETTDDPDGLGYTVRVLKDAAEISSTQVRQPSTGVLEVNFQSNTLGSWRKEFSATTLGGDNQAVALTEFALGGQPLRTKISAEWNNSPTEIVQAKATRNAQNQIIEQTQRVYTKLLRSCRPDEDHDHVAGLRRQDRCGGDHVELRRQ